MQARNIRCPEFDLFCFVCLFVCFVFFFILKTGILMNIDRKKKLAKFYNQVVCIEKLGLFVADI